MDWKKKALLEFWTGFKNDLPKGLVITLAAAAAIQIWQIRSGNGFQWQDIEPIEQPSILAWAFYSMLGFFTIGALLYKIRFYQALYFIMVRIIGDHREYRKAKAAIWIGVILATFWLAMKVVELINSCLSGIYNICAYLIYAGRPAVGVLVAYVLIVYLIRRFQIGQKPVV